MTNNDVITQSLTRVSSQRQIAHLAEGLERHEAARLLAEEKLRTALSDISILKTQIQTAEQRIESIIAEK